MAPKLAVLMCASNAEPFIREAIDSILSQTYKDFEFIIVENGSTDRTWDIIRSYNDPRIKSFSTKIKQLTFNLNYGLLQTNAEYIARIDADDIARPERFERQLAYLDAHPEITVLGTAFEIFGEGISNKIVTLPLTDKVIRRRLPFIFSICHPTVIFKREVILNVSGYSGPEYVEDFHLWIKLSRDKSVKFANLQEPLLLYRVHKKQRKGTKESYVNISGLLLSEALYRRSPSIFLGFVLSCFKIFRSKNKL